MPVSWEDAGGLLADRYQLVERVGSGGMAVVWRATDTVLGRDVAIKLLSSEAAGDDGMPGARLKAEAQAIARLKHQHITGIYDFGQHIDPAGIAHPFAVMELVDGVTLHQVLAEGKTLTWQEATGVAAQAASALDCAHRQGIVHRDISAANIMLTGDGVKVLDFGIAALSGQTESPMQHGLLGTPAYLAPERLSAADTVVTAATDVYALGVIWYHLLTGTMPWKAHSTTGILQAHLVYAPAPLPAVEGMPPELADLCMSCLAKHPEDRPSSRELASRLAGYAYPARRSSVGSPTVTATVPRRRKSVMAVGAGTVLAAVALAGVTVPGWLQPRQVAGPPPSINATPSTGVVAVVPSLPHGETGAPTGPAPVARTASPPATTAAPSQAPSTPPPTTPGGGHTVTARGGTVQVTCQGGTGRIISVQPAAGFTVKDHDPGPAGEVQAVLTSARHESEIKIRCEGGVPHPKVKETPQ